MPNILITGISKGVGLQITKTLLAQGNTVYGISRSMTEELQSVIDESNGQLHWMSYDLENTSDVKSQIFQSFLKDVPLHGFVNNAAMAYDTLLTNMNEAEVMKMTIINQIAPMLLTKYVIRNMILHDVKGSIVHLSSISVHTGYKGLSMYAATKGALEAFSKNTAREWGIKGIRSNCIVAGFMETDMTNTMTDDIKNKIYNRTSLKVPTNVNSLAETCAFLLSEKSISITGQNIFVDSGTI